MGKKIESLQVANCGASSEKDKRLDFNQVCTPCLVKITLLKGPAGHRRNTLSYCSHWLFIHFILDIWYAIHADDRNIYQHMLSSSHKSYRAQCIGSMLGPCQERHLRLHHLWIGESWANGWANSRAHGWDAGEKFDQRGTGNGRPFTPFGSESEVGPCRSSDFSCQGSAKVASLYEEHWVGSEPLPLFRFSLSGQCTSRVPVWRALGRKWAPAVLQIFLVRAVQKSQPRRRACLIICCFQNPDYLYLFIVHACIYGLVSYYEFNNFVPRLEHAQGRA